MIQQAFISGQLGMAIYTENRERLVLDVDEPGQPGHCTGQDVSMLFHSGAEFSLLSEPVKDLEQLASFLKRETQAHTALTLILCSMDPSLDETRLLSIEAAEELLQDAYVHSFVKRRLLARPLPESADMGGARSGAASANAPGLVALLDTVQESQPYIQAVLQAWNHAAKTHFATPEQAADAESFLIELGMFDEWVSAIAQRSPEKLKSLIVKFVLDQTISTKVPQVRRLLHAMKNSLRLSPVQLLGTRAPEEGAGPLILGELGASLNLNLWRPRLENRSDPGLHRPRLEEEVFTHAIEAYAGLIRHMLEDQEKAIQFCVASCSQSSAVLQRETVRTLLPRLLVASRGDQRLVQAYKNLFAGLREINTEEQQMLLAAIFGGLPFAAEVDSRNVSYIWEQAFAVAIANVGWAWEGEGAKIGTIWCIAMEHRLPHSDLQEKEFLRQLTGHYLKNKDSRSRPVSYLQIARLFHMIGESMKANRTVLRKPDRVVVPNNIPLSLRIAIREGVSPAPVIAQLVNFSLDDSGGEVQGRGAWATALVDPQWPPASGWRAAGVTVMIPHEANVQFDQAKVLGPLPEGEGAHRYYGFRIQLGPASPEESIRLLKFYWDKWPKR